MLLKKKALLRNLKNFTINFGPLHPVAHGVSKSVFQFGREVIKSAYAHIGFLHSGAEKLIEYKNYLQALQDFDPFDYISTMFLMNINECLNFGVFFSLCSDVMSKKIYI
jgi:NADH:ubiquinone oxidoreductase subunit D